MAQQSSSPSDPTSVDPELRKAVEAAREIWIRKLIDPSRGNTLLFFRDLKVGTLDLTPIPEVVERLLAGRSLDANNLIQPVDTDSQDDQRPATDHIRALREERHREVLHRLISIQRKALANLEEKGLETLFVALGMATWPAPDGGRPYEAPVLLIPAELTSRAGFGEGLRLAVSGEPQANLILLDILKRELDVSIEPESLVQASATEDEEGGWRVSPESAYRMLERAVPKGTQFKVRRRAVLGNFQFAKMAMVEDLRRNDEHLVRSPIIAAVAGHLPSRRALAAETENLDPRELDDRLADDEHLVLDADSSQQRVVAIACRGENGVVQGPPGTGKSQTIANLIAELVAHGKRVLFVAEKRAALEAVTKRLSDPRVDLGHLVLDVHGASVSRKEVMAKLASTLGRIRSTTPVDNSTLHREFEGYRDRLKRHANRMNVKRAPTDYSLCTIEGLLLRLPPEARTEVRWRGQELAAFTPDRVREIHDRLMAAAALNTLFLGVDLSPWNNAAIRTGERAQQAIDEVRRTAGALWTAFEGQLKHATTPCGLRSPESVTAAGDLVRLFRELSRLRELYPSDLFRVDTRPLVVALGPATRGAWANGWAWLTNRSFRAARSKLRSLRKISAPAATLWAEARAAEKLRERWVKLGGQGLPSIPDAAQRFTLAYESLVESLRSLEEVTGRKDLRQVPLATLTDLLEKLASDGRTPFKLPHVYELRDQLSSAGLQALVDDIRRADVAPGLWTRRFDYAWLHSALDAAMVNDPELAAFQGREHDRCVAEFVRLDEERLRHAAARVRRAHGEYAIHAMNAFPDQADVLRREAYKRSRHIPLRDLLARASDVMTRIAPCWLASPLSVSQLLDGSRNHFDVVVFDEASQVLPEEAIPALMRAPQVVVAGDRHQLPPTTFFATGVEGEDEDNEATEAVEGFESILDVMSTFLPNWLLEWHYRSEDERLIAFSNRHIYSDRLITFPSARAQDTITHELVPHLPGVSSQEESSSPEVEKVIRQVIHHYETRPDETLGVIAMGIKHANRVQAALDRALYDRQDLTEFFSLEREERFFVKNLETVQGDERDAIIISIGYGKTSDGDLPHRFGPLTQDVGYRRLNVAITRARRRVTVVSSFRHDEVDLKRSAGRGVKLLKSYLEYVASRGRTLPGSEGATEFPLNPFEADVKDALEARGLKLLPQYGTSNYRIDLVALHPERPSRPVLAIECDGASYHSGATARERDRLRQQQLMRRGWRFHRIWSTDWFYHREEEIERAQAAYEEAMSYTDVADADPVADGATSHPPQSLTGVIGKQAPKRAPFPNVPRRVSISDYSPSDLRRVAEWAMSDGLLRTDDELVRDMMAALGFKRLGSQLRIRLQQAIRDARAQQARGRQGNGPLHLL